MNKHIQTGITALTSLIPFVGSPISIIINDYYSQRKEDRIYKFISDISGELKSNEKDIRREYVSNHEFLDVFENTLRRVVFERQEAKRDAYKNILVHSMITENATYDDTEIFQYYIDVFRIHHLEILKVFYDSPKMKNDNERDARTQAILGVCRVKTKIEENDTILELIGDLENSNLIDGYIADYGAIGGMGGLLKREGASITTKGKRFIDFILG